ncbi:hypothetical protein L2E82_42570 [Cichorium intybus]|uniref:Uncharacterized protein n=1 Tax=Cichorium intybus TaxID=13427 RepID=A0ACB8ZND9_CICIN|nr:hypothetical protein L2E82_42570 [Cichorium intybus]
MLLHELVAQVVTLLWNAHKPLIFNPSDISLQESEAFILEVFNNALLDEERFLGSSSPIAPIHNLRTGTTSFENDAGGKWLKVFVAVAKGGDDGSVYLEVKVAGDG